MIRLMEKNRVTKAEPAGHEDVKALLRAQRDWTRDVMADLRPVRKGLRIILALIIAALVLTVGALTMRQNAALGRIERLEETEATLTEHIRVLEEAYREYSAR